MKKSFVTDRPRWSPEGTPCHRGAEDTEKEQRRQNPRTTSALANQHTSTALFFKNHWHAPTWAPIHLSNAPSERSVSRHFLCEFLCGLRASVVFEDTFSHDS